ncbi:4-hydroxyacetophenone monooxygenase [Mycolicibacterium chubuense]|uniref:4-hydroxyacetophenone monooxygenase n=1 Tax=Mycolicibacterium chubuense TaxID=1800 RepID=A0A0J6W6G5_MYCCU|nr:NAD(P)/FAD-dependent oxidoreductase [Mycolicibacterium chubuense]KMO77222.1 4-hydroxyacetophenone monooxygenase [Mycolicibacterium chubuense]ORA50896.1 4-hydroxyacetophenone monooxygenase [Mycolicibacterium chubuense]SPY00205.1 putative flavoprotein involved in K+ transport [Mycolicibacterium chubuense]
MARPRIHDTLIVGAGFSGLGAAVKLRQAGVDDVVIVERSDRVGGTWRDNTYPGVACDIPTMLYSFSFADNPTWSRMYPSGGEIYAHIEDLTDRHGLRPLIRFDTEITGLSFDERAGVWTATTKGRKRFAARTVVLAAGPLADHKLPDIRGIDTYRGRTIHSAAWDHDFDVTGKRVAVIGTGASAVQIVPELVKTAAFVKVFQRTPGWVLPRPDVEMPTSVQALFAKVPAAQELARQVLFWGHEACAAALVWNTPLSGLVAALGKAHLRATVKDAWLRRQLTPGFTPGCKRMLISNDYYPALQRDNCKLIDWPIATISPAGIRTSDGVEHHLDAIVFATGYDVHLSGPPFPVTGLGGRSLQQEWADHAEAFKSASAHGFPNLFFMTGPNSGPGHNSLLVYIEGQIDYAVSAVTTILGQNLRYLDVRADTQRRYNAAIQQRLTRTTWMSGCRSWYLTADGFNASMYPGLATQYLRQMRQFRLDDYHAVAHEVRARTVTSTA